MNLLCAEGLPGAEDLNVQDCLKNLDDCAAQVKEETQRHEYRFNEHPEQFRNSIGYYHMMMLGTVLVQDLGIQYNPQLALPQLDGKIPTLGQNANAKDVFIHGLGGLPPLVWMSLTAGEVVVFFVGLCLLIIGILLVCCKWVNPKH
jgi:hypothetical protein